MAGILLKKLKGGDNPDLLIGLSDIKTPEPCDYHLVTITTKASEQCNLIHHRMPLFIPADRIKPSIIGTTQDTNKLLVNQAEVFNVFLVN